ncbi:MAG: hypothetical protein ABSB61_02420 [Anaerolineales bacterium]|jgi:hypothetical protein
MNAVSQTWSPIQPRPQGAGALEAFVRDHEIALYAVAMASALALRFAGLSAPSLSDSEAAQAWVALRMAQGQITAGAGAFNPLYTVLTAALFFVVGAGNFWARLWPALAGSAVVLLPLWMKQVLARTEAILASFLLALSPGITAISHLSGGATLALLPVGILLLLAVEGQLAKRPGLAGICAGIALAAGADGLTGLLLLLLSVVIVSLLAKVRISAEGWEALLREDASTLWRSSRFWVASALSFAIAVSGLIFPAGLGVFASGLQKWAAELVQPGSYSIGQMALLLLGYEGLAFVGCLTAAVILLSERPGRGGSLLLVFFALGAAWSLFRPGRSPADGIWVIFAMALLAGKGAYRILGAFAASRSRWASRGQVMVSLALGVFAWQSFAGHAVLGGRVPDSSAALRLGVGAVAILAMIVIAGLFATSWNENVSVAAAGLGLAVGILLLVGQISAAAGLGLNRRGEANELWWPSATTNQLSFLVSNLQQISEWQTGTAQDLPIVVSGNPDGALGWALRSFPRASYDVQSGGAAPAVYLSMEVAGNQPAPPFPASYMGEPFTVQVYRAWTDFPPDLFAWWIYRMGPTRAERVILWVRQDVENPDAGKG